MIDFKNIKNEHSKYIVQRLKSMLITSDDNIHIIIENLSFDFFENKLKNLNDLCIHTFQDKEYTIDALNDDLKEIIDINRELEDRCDDADSVLLENETLNAQVLDLENTIDAINLDKDDLQTELTRLQTQYDKLEEEFDDYRWNVEKPYQ